MNAQKTPVWLMCLLNAAIFILGQLIAIYYYWIGKGYVAHDVALEFGCIIAGFISCLLNAFLWVLRSEVV